MRRGRLATAVWKRMFVEASYVEVLDDQKSFGFVPVEPEEPDRPQLGQHHEIHGG